MRTLGMRPARMKPTRLGRGRRVHRKRDTETELSGQNPCLYFLNTGLPSTFHFSFFSNWYVMLVFFGIRVPPTR